jgi:hypothetical protein
MRRRQGQRIRTRGRRRGHSELHDRKDRQPGLLVIGLLAERRPGSAQRRAVTSPFAARDAALSSCSQSGIGLRVDRGRESARNPTICGRLERGTSEVIGVQIPYRYNNCFQNRQR